MKHAHVVTVDEAHSVEHFTWVKHASLASCRGWDTSPVMERSFDIFLLSASVQYVMVRVKFRVTNESLIDYPQTCVCV